MASSGSQHHQKLDIQISNSEADDGWELSTHEAASEMKSPKEIDGLQTKCKAHAPSPDYSSILMSSCHDTDPDIGMSFGDLSPTSVDFFDAASKITSSKRSESNFQGALKRCEAREKLLDKLSKLQDLLGGDSWSTSDDRQVLAAQLKHNTYFSAIQSRMLPCRLGGGDQEPGYLRQSDTAKSEADLSQLSRSGGSDFARDADALLMLEQQALRTVRAMLEHASTDVPLCREEAHEILATTRSLFNPAKHALATAGRRAASEKESNPASARFVDLVSPCSCSCVRVVHDSTLTCLARLLQQAKEGPQQSGGHQRARRLAHHPLRQPL